MLDSKLKIWIPQPWIQAISISEKGKCTWLVYTDKHEIDIDFLPQRINMFPLKRDYFNRKYMLQTIDFQRLC